MHRYNMESNKCCFTFCRKASACVSACVSLLVSCQESEVLSLIRLRAVQSQCQDSALDFFDVFCMLIQPESSWIEKTPMASGGEHPFAGPCLLRTLTAHRYHHQSSWWIVNTFIDISWHQILKGYKSIKMTDTLELIVEKRDKSFFSSGDAIENTSQLLDHHDKHFITSHSIN